MITTADEISRPIACTVNGDAIRAHVPVRLSLADWLRHELGLTATHVGCEHGVCGACTILLDGRTARSCLTLAVQADGCVIETLEGAVTTGQMDALREAFFQYAALQCGFCTPGMLMTAAELLASNASPSRAEIREALSGNYCRCTGYEPIVDAVAAAATILRSLPSRD
jgi:aerobic-type carbon monoxide dehydrogenase small subunit (CoxS/CutS family)